VKENQTLELTLYRIQQAHDSLREAEILLREEAWRGSINRAYYAMFYAIMALAVVRGFSTSKHTGIIAFFNREFVKKEIFPKELSKKLHLAFERRLTQDYGELAIIDRSLAETTLSDAFEFVDAIETYLINSVYSQLQSNR
jgi:uncharacterized protein (UPF0332 family)